MKLNNKYYILRHGEALSNLKDVLSCWPEKFVNHLTKKGVAQVKKAAAKLKKKNINYIFASDILRTKETAEIIAKKLNISVKFDKRLREQNVGVLNGQTIVAIREFFGLRGFKRFKIRPERGERYSDIGNRMVNFLRDINKKYKGKNILIISHEFPLVLLMARLSGASNEEFYSKERKINKAELKELN